MKIQKLCYYSQAWGMVWADKKPLFCQDFEAWRDGPVNKDLWDLHKGKFTISSDDILVDFLENDLTSEQIGFINKVLDFYGTKDGAWLSDLTHKEKPWRETRDKCRVKDGEYCEAIITKASIYNYYANL